MGAMGIGRVGRPDVIFKRKFRWTMEIKTPGGLIPRHYVKLAARPKLSIDSTEINFLNATTWIPGKAKWEPISVTYYDIPDQTMKPLWDWIASIYDFQKPADLFQSEKAGWNGEVNLMLFDGCGNELERWQLLSCWPESVDFGDLDYANSDEVTMELSLRYSEVIYKGVCGPTPNGTCRGC